MYAGPVPDLLLCGGPMLRLYDLIDGVLDLTFDIEFLPIDLGPQGEKEGLGAFPFGGAGGIILVLIIEFRIQLQNVLGAGKLLSCLPVILFDLGLGLGDIVNLLEEKCVGASRVEVKILR